MVLNFLNLEFYRSFVWSDEFLSPPKWTIYSTTLNAEYTHFAEYFYQGII